MNTALIVAHIIEFIELHFLNGVRTQLFIHHHYKKNLLRISKKGVFFSPEKL